MAFEEIEVINPRNPSKPLIVVPDDGVLVRPGQITIAATRTVSRFIRVKIGAKLARGISLTAEQHNLRMAFGTDADAGKIQISVDNTAGKFRATRDKLGNYTTTINAHTADGLFALLFPTFTVAGISFSPGGAHPPRFIFNASPEMLAVEE